MEIGLLIIRVVVGALLVGHGTQKLFGWFGGPGIAGASGYLRFLGYPAPTFFAVVAGLSEALGGALLGLGLLTPLAAAIVVGTMLNAFAAHVPNFWVQNQGGEYPFVLAVLGAGFAFTGAGTYSLDTALGLDLTSTSYGLAAVVLGVLAALGTLFLRRLGASSAAEPQAA